MNWPAKTWIYHLCADTRCCLKNLTKAMFNGKRELREFMLLSWFDDYDDVSICEQEYLPHNYRYNPAQGQFSSRIQLVWIQSFHSLWLVIIPKLKSPDNPTIELWFREEEMDSFLLLKHEVKCKQPYPGFDLSSPYPLPMKITAMLYTPVYACIT